MNIDKQKLKALAEAAPYKDWSRSSYEALGGRAHIVMHGAFDHLITTFEESSAEFIAAASPGTVLALLAEIEDLHAQHGRDSGELRKLCSARDSARRQRDQLKAENEALRSGQAIKRLSCGEVREAFNGAYYQPRDIGSDGEQCRAGVLAVIEAAMTKEASHDR